MDCSGTTKIAVLIPCYNEAKTIGKVIDDFRVQLPAARVVVFDNNSTDNTISIAVEHGAEVVREPRQGKGFVVGSMLGAVDADTYIMVDGDDTYPASHVHSLIGPVLNQQADMAVGARLTHFDNQSFRNFHLFGNRLVRGLINLLMDSNLQDILSGYRVFNRAIADMIPVVSSGFEIETELTIQTLYYQRKIIEINIPYGVRPEGSSSKLSTFRDGIRILWKLFSLFRTLKPLTFFGAISILLCCLGLLAGFMPVYDYFTSPNHEVKHVPLAILATGLIILSGQFAFLGILLHAINWRFRELHSIVTRKRTVKDR